MEKVYNFNISENKLIEKILDDDNAMINHMILNQGDSLPQHNSNSNVYMIILKGIISLQLGDNPAKEYINGNIVNIPYGVKMNISNEHCEQLEFFVIKAPSPRLFEV